MGEEKMKLALIFLCCLFSGCARYASLSDCLRERGQPVVVATGYGLVEDAKLRTISLYGLDQSELAPLFSESDRFLVYTSDIRFAQHVGYHFQDRHDPKVHTGYTIFATLIFGTDLDLIHFDSKGRFVEERHIVIDVAYLEEGTEGHLVRIRPAK